MAETIGQRLKKAREYRNLSLEKAADATHIRSVYLRALEADDFSTMPSPVQARGFLRNYAQYLNLDLDLETTISDFIPLREAEFDMDHPNLFLTKFLSSDWYDFHRLC